MEILSSLVSVLSDRKISKIDSFKKLKNEDYFVYHFLAFLEKEDNQKIYKEILSVVEFSFKNFYNKKIRNSINISEGGYYKLQTVFILKSLKKSNFEMINNIEKLTTIDNVLNAHLKFEKKYWIFKEKKLYPFCSSFKKEIFRIYSLLSLKKIIQEKIIVNNLKTHKQWILDYEDFENSEIEKFKISFEPFKIVEISDRFFMFSTFFNLTTEIFKENLKSSKRFNLKNKDYLEKLCQTALYFDEKAFSEIYLRKSSNRDIKLEIRNLLTKIKMINEEIEILSNMSKDEYVNKFKLKLKRDLINLKEMSLFLPYKKFTSNWISENFKKVIDEDSLNRVWGVILDKLIMNNKNLTKEEQFENFLNNNKLIIFNSINNMSLNEKKNPILTENDINVFIEDSYKKLINIYKNLNLSDEIKIEYGIEMGDIKRLKNNRVLIYSELSKLYQLNYLELILNLKDKLLNKKLYFPIFYDFRGRMYVHSSIGITNFKLARYFFHYGLYRKEEIAEQNNFNISEIHKFKKVIETVKKKWDILTHFNCLNECIFWCLIAVGKEFINKTKISSSTEEIITEGLKRVITDNSEKDDEKWIIIEHYKRIISSLKSEKIYKRFILKDATASFIQNAIRIIGPKNKISLEYANLGISDRWFDTYSLALDFWKNSLFIKNNFISIETKKGGLKEIKLINSSELEFFIRKTVKKPVMTDAYEASYYSKWDYFKKEVREEFKINVETRSDLEILFKNFNEFLENNFWDQYFLCERSDIMIKHVTELLDNKKEILISSSDSESNMVYYKSKDKVMDVTVTIPETNKKVRKTKKFSILDEDSLDIKKIKTAIKPNWVHFSDALLTRQINSLLNNPLFTVHDCFLVDCLSVSSFIIKANKSFKTLDTFSIAKNRELLQKVNSIFIFF